MPERSIVVVLWIALSACWIVGAHAQSADVATDKELYAAYCLGVARVHAEWPSIVTKLKGFGFEADREVVEGEQQMRESLDRDISRFRGYLAARGFLSGSSRSRSAATGVQVAIQHGRADAGRCDRRLDTCVKKCSLKRPYIPKCATDCGDEENACRESARCFQDDQLPF
jgi:hypothetical protein